MSVLTISREFGSAGTEIGKKVADTLGYHFTDKNSIVKILSQYGFIKFGQEYETVPTFWDRFDSRRAEMVEMLNRVIFALAAHGNMVIIGRGSFVLLSDYVDVLNVRTQAPLPVRISRIMEHHNVSQTTAKTMVDENDMVRATFIESSYNVRWDSTTHFDLVIDTSKIPIEPATNLLIETVKALDASHWNNRSSTVEIDVDPVLANVVCQTLDCYREHLRI